MQQRGDRISEQLVEELAVSRAEVGQHVTPTPPQIHMEGRSRWAQPAELPGTADGLDGGEHPQRHKDLRIDRIASDPTYDGLNPGLQRLQIERIDIRPDGLHAVIAGDQLIERGSPPLHLKPLRQLHTNRPRTRIGPETRIVL
jgi:hypothetical protein